MADASWYHSACVSVRAATGLPPYCRHVLLHFVYEHTTAKRVLTKSPPATVRQQGMAIWTDATAVVPTTSPCVTIELWHAHRDHDLFLGCVEVALTKSPPTPEVGPVWVMVHAARYEGVPTTGMSLEVVVSYMQASTLRRTKPVGPAPSVVDPAFRFRVPHLDINWAEVVSTNVQEIFFLGTTDPLLALQSTVLYGNTLATLDIDIDKDHEKAFQMCQFAAQYLQSCVDLLTQRQAQYEGALTDLVQRQADLRDQRQAKKHLLHKLRKQAADCDVLLTAYDVVAVKLPPPTTTPAPPTATTIAPSIAVSLPTAETIPSPPSVEKSTDHESLKATAMLTTYEERMEKLRLAKEATRAERIEAEKRRLLQTMAEQAKQREWRDALALQDSAAVHIAACRLQAWCRHLAFIARYRRDRHQFLAAQCIQARVRQRHAARAVLLLRQRRAIEATQMHLQYEHVQREQAARVEAQRQADIKALEPVLLLWNDLQHAFATAIANGTDVFGFFDRKRCGSVDRASFRQQLARLGFDVPRPVIRRLIQQIHAKNQFSSSHLGFTRPQFNTAFELQDIEPPPPPVVEPLAVPPSLQEEQAPLQTTSTTPTGDMDSIEHLSSVIHALRARILEAATARLGHGTSLSFEAMKAALASVFESLDTEAGGDLPLASFRDGLQSALHLHFEDDVWAIVDACLDVDGSGSISIAEFVSFAFTSPTSEELGVLGYRLRDAILQRIKAARKDAGGLEAAVQAVFYPLYKRATDAAPVAAFCHTLQQLHLGFSPPQLSRLVMRLDNDGDHTISLDELLRWLKLRTGPKVVVEAAQPRLSMSSLVVKQVRDALVSVARAHHDGNVKSLFEAMDANGSKQLNAREIHAFLREHTPLPLSAIDAAVRCMDVGGNGVVSKSELVAFCSEATETEEVGVLAEQCRAALLHLDVPALQAWFEALDPTARGQVRVAEVRKALKKLVKLHDHDVDLVLQRLDKDKSGAISTAEMLSWVHPVRDIEVLLALVESNASLQALSLEALVAALDADGNGAVGIDELHAGLNLYGLRLQRAEAALLLDEFDIDNDGILTKGELQAMLTNSAGDAYSSDEDAPDDAYGYGEDGFDED